MAGTARILLVLFLLSSVGVTVAAENIFSSGKARNTVVELYTSEGCSSCPPAEEYLNGLKENTSLWKSIIPMAFHVDYWDYIGWRDPYAHPSYSQRQRTYARVHQSRTIYTPAFVVNGAIWRRSIFSRTLPESQDIVGELTVKLAGNKVSARYLPAKGTGITGTLQLNVALLGMGLKTHIRAGENKGRLALHEFVVLGVASRLSDSGRWQMVLPKPAYKGARKHAFSAWVSVPGDPTPLQAVGAYLK